jgi:hypothetical protein
MIYGTVETISQEASLAITLAKILVHCCQQETTGAKPENFLFIVASFLP